MSLARMMLVATVMVAPAIAGCGQDSERKIANVAHPPVHPLAPGSETGIDSSKVDRGAAGMPRP